MKLSAIERTIQILGDGNVQATAERLGVGRAAVYHWRNGVRRPHPATAREIERLTGGKVKAVELAQ